MISQDTTTCKKASIEISTAEGKNHRVPAVVVDAAPGLAVTMNGFGYFTVTHINTGYSMCATYERFTSALLVLSEFALIAKDNDFSWLSIESDNVKGIISSHGDKPIPFDGHTIIVGGEERKATVAEWIKGLRFMAFGGLVDEFPWEESDKGDLALENFERLAD